MESQAAVNAITGIPELQQSMVLWRYFYGMDDREIAERLGIEPKDAGRMREDAVLRCHSARLLQAAGTA